MKKNQYKSFAVPVVLVGTLLAGLTACKGPVRTSDEDLELIDYKGVVRLLENRKKPTVIIDVRDAGRFASGHIPGAINIPIPDMRAADPRLVEVHNLVVYSDRGRQLLSHAGSKRLLQLGYQNVFDYREGLEAWKQQGGQVVTGQ